MKTIIEANLTEAKEVLDDFINQPENIASIERSAPILTKCLAKGGKTGGLLAGMVDSEIRVKGRTYSDRIQEVHIKILHILVLLIEQGIK